MDAEGNRDGGGRGSEPRRFGWAWAAFFLLLPGCNAGQTGQPGGFEGCDDPALEIAIDGEIGGVVPLEAAREIEGNYVSRLVWRDPSDEWVSEIEDEVTVDLRYDGGRAFQQCGRPSIEMTMSVSTRDSGIEESGIARMTPYPVTPEPTWSEGNLIYPHYTRADVGLEHEPVFIWAEARTLPSRVALSGSITIMDRARTTERYAHFPTWQSACLSEHAADAPVLEPTAAEALAWLEGLAPAEFTSDTPGLVVPTIGLEATGTVCDEGGIGRVLVSVTLSSDASSDVASGELTLLYRAEDPEVEFISLHVWRSPTLAVDHALLFPMESTCTPHGYQLTIDARRTGREDDPFEVLEAQFLTSCAPPAEL